MLSETLPDLAPLNLSFGILYYAYLCPVLSSHTFLLSTS